MSDKTEKVVLIKNREERLDRLRAYHVGMSYVAFVERRATLRKQMEAVRSEKKHAH